MKEKKLYIEHNKLWYKLEWFVGEVLMKLGLINSIVWSSTKRFIHYYRK